VDGIMKGGKNYHCVYTFGNQVIEFKLCH